MSLKLKLWIVPHIINFALIFCVAITYIILPNSAEGAVANFLSKTYISYFNYRDLYKSVCPTCSYKYGFFYLSIFIISLVTIATAFALSINRAPILNAKAKIFSSILLIGMCWGTYLGWPARYSYYPMLLSGDVYTVMAVAFGFPSLIFVIFA